MFKMFRVVLVSGALAFEFWLLQKQWGGVFKVLLKKILLFMVLSV